jgi:hypothetical protein
MTGVPEGVTVHEEPMRGAVGDEGGQVGPFGRVAARQHHHGRAHRA